MTDDEQDKQRLDIAFGNHQLVLTKRSTATSYHFAIRPEGYGWAICTVNDESGELQVMSDWGHWAYRWHVEHIGRPSLTHFIGERSRDGRHYLADKLTSSDRNLRYRFSPEKTIADMCARICEKRREGKIARELARELWDALGDLEHTDNVDDFVRGFYDIDDHEHITKYAIEMEHLREEHTGSYLVLRDKILPALIDACAATVAQRELAAVQHQQVSQSVH
jgi:hypothetical protein